MLKEISILASNYAYYLLNLSFYCVSQVRTKRITPFQLSRYTMGKTHITPILNGEHPKLILIIVRTRPPSRRGVTTLLDLYI